MSIPQPPVSDVPEPSGGAPHPNTPATEPTTGAAASNAPGSAGAQIPDATTPAGSAPGAQSSAPTGGPGMPTDCWPTVEGVGGTARPFHRAEDFPTTPPNDGRSGWTIGLIVLVPLFGALVAPLVMLITASTQRRKNPVAAHVSRNVMIYAGITLAMLIIGMACGVVTTFYTDKGAEPPTWLFFPLIPSIGWSMLIAPIVTLIMAIIGFTRPVSREKAAKILAKAPKA